MIKIILIVCSASLIISCSSISKEYEADVFPKGEFKPINPEYFNKDEAQRIFEGMKPK